jgi:hypothetical protein
MYKRYASKWGSDGFNFDEMSTKYKGINSLKTSSKKEFSPFMNEMSIASLPPLSVLMLLLFFSPAYELNVNKMASIERNVQ